MLPMHLYQQDYLESHGNHELKVNLRKQVFILFVMFQEKRTNGIKQNITWKRLIYHQGSDINRGGKIHSSQL